MATSPNVIVEVSDSGQATPLMTRQPAATEFTVPSVGPSRNAPMPVTDNPSRFGPSLGISGGPQCRQFELQDHGFDISGFDADWNLNW